MRATWVCGRTFFKGGLRSKPTLVHTYIRVQAIGLNQRTEGPLAEGRYGRIGLIKDQKKRKKKEDVSPQGHWLRPQAEPKAQGRVGLFIGAIVGSLLWFIRWIVLVCSTFSGRSQCIYRQNRSDLLRISSQYTRGFVSFSNFYQFLHNVYFQVELACGAISGCSLFEATLSSCSILICCCQLILNKFQAETCCSLGGVY